MARENVICYNPDCKWNKLGGCSATYIILDKNGVCEGGTKERYKPVSKEKG